MNFFLKRHQLGQLGNGSGPGRSQGRRTYDQNMFSEILKELTKNTLNDKVTLLNCVKVDFRID